MREARELILPTEADGRLAASFVWGETDYFTHALSYLDSKGIRLIWGVKPLFKLDQPLNFTIYRSEDWGESFNALDTVTNQWTYLDTIPHSGVLKFVYKIKLETEGIEHESESIFPYGGLPFRFQQIAKCILRRAFFCPRHARPFDGILLKRKLSGEPCICVDPITKDILNPNCKLCIGTGKRGGYWQQGMRVQALARSPFSLLPTFDNNVSMGTLVVNPIQILTAGLPPIFKYDVWVHLASGIRFYVNQSKVVAEVEGCPVVQQLVLSPAPLNDIIYSVKYDI